MAQLWKLVFLCGLLAGTSKAQAVRRVQTQTYVQEGYNTYEQRSGRLDNVGPVGQEGLEVLTQKLQSELTTLQDSNVWKGLTKVVKESKSFLGGLLSNVGSLGEELTSVRILDVKLEVNPDTKSMVLRFPIRASLNVALPFLGQLANLDISVDLLSTTTLQDLESGNPSLVLGTCRSDPASLKLNLFNGKSPALSGLVNKVMALKEKIVCIVVENAVCPLLHLVIESQAGAIIRNILQQITASAHVGI